MTQGVHHIDDFRDHGPSASPGGRLPVYDLDAESAVLSAAMLDRDALTEVRPVVAPADFFDPKHRRVCEAIYALDDANERIDAVTVGYWLKARERLAEVGGIAYLSHLVDATPAVANVAAHATIVRDLARQRDLVARCQRVAAEGYNRHGNVRAWLESSATELGKAADGAAKKRVTIGQALVRTFEKLKRAHESGTTLGLPTGLAEFDRVTGGLFPGDQIILAARPGMGKSGLALTIALNVAATGRRVFYVSPEMPDEQLAMRAVCAEADVPVEGWRRGTVRPEDIVQASQWVHQLPIVVEDSTENTAASIRAEARRMAREPEGLALVVVDYLQMIRPEADKRHGSREQEVNDTALQLKRLAKDLDVPMVCLSSLNRAVDSRNDKRPIMSDLRDSGGIESHADAVVMLYRDEYYNPGGRLDDGRANTGVVEVLLEKCRNGRTGKFELFFNGPTTSFRDIESGP
jgi:replicative DNA helicase